MARHWICPSGHEGSGPLPGPLCPTCGLPVQQAAGAETTPDETLVGAAGQAQPAARSASAGRAFLDRPVEPPPPAADSSGDTLQRPATVPTRALFEPPATETPTWQPPATGQPPLPPHEETLQKPSNGHAPSVPPRSGTGQVVQPDLRSGEGSNPPSGPHGDTLVRPSEAPAGGSRVTAPAVVSGYEILGILGRGGMGVVYKARQVGLNRIVALKMILHGGHASPTDLLRFKIEAEAVAQLQHPNIVQVHEIGERDGRPFFSLEFLPGGSLQQRLEGPLPPAVAAALVEQLARAMDYAHRRGIVHRDLKPANILVADPAGTPLERCTIKITDFGLAKRLQDDHGQTRSLDILGTPAYMAPEQAHGSKDVGPLADVYALGAILYDLLTGQPPFRGDTVLDTLDLVRKAEPVPPARLRPNCPLDLQTICLKCLQKQPGQRYASALDLADDLRAFLDGRPISARPTPWYERAGKWARRRPAVAALLALSILAPLIVTAVSVVSAVQISDANRQLQDRQEKLGAAYDALEISNSELQDRKVKLEKALAGEATQRRKAEEARRRAEEQERDAQDSFLQAQKAVEDLLSLAKQRLRNEPGTEKVRRALLEDAVRMCRHFTNKPSATPASRYRAARAYRLMADMQAELKQHAAAEANYRRSLRLFDELRRQPAVKGEQATEEALAVAMHLWAMLEEIDPPRAEKTLAQVRKRLEEMPAGQADQPLRRRAHAVVLANQAIHFQNRGQYDRAEADYDQAARELAELKGVEGVALERARVDINRAALWLAGNPNWTDQKRRDALEKAYQVCTRAVRELDALLRDRPNDTTVANELGRAYTNLGLVRVAQGELKEAGQVHDQAVVLFERLQREHTDIVNYRHLLAVALGNQGLQLLREGLPQRASEPLARGRDLLEGLVKGFPDVPVYREDLARLCNGVGLAQLRGTQPDRAREPLEMAVHHLEKAVADNPQRDGLRRELLGVCHNLALYHDNRARAAATRKDWAAVEPHVRALVKLRQRRAQLLEQLPAETIPSRAGRWLEVLLARADFLGTLRAHTRVLVAVGKHQEAADSIEQQAKLVAASYPGWEQSARLLCRCIVLARKDADLDEQTRARLIERYGSRALSILEGLVGRVPELADTLASSSFDPLRDGAFSARYRLLVRKLGK